MVFVARSWQFIVTNRHFHLDHAAALPYFTEKLPGFRGKIYATHSTVAVMRIMLPDYVRVSNISAAENQLYTEEDITRCLARIELVDFKQVCGASLWGMDWC